MTQNKIPYFDVTPLSEEGERICSHRQQIYSRIKTWPRTSPIDYEQLGKDLVIYPEDAEEIERELEKAFEEMNLESKRIQAKMEHERKFGKDLSKGWGVLNPNIKRNTLNNSTFNVSIW